MGIRDTTFYGWQNIFEANYSPFKTTEAGATSDIPIVVSKETKINDFKISPLTSSIFYIAATAYRSDGVQKWQTYRSLNSGQTWLLVDTDPENSEQSVALGVDFDLSGNIYVAGCANTASVDNQQFYRSLIRKSSTGDSGSWTTIDSFAAGGNWGYSTNTRSSYRSIKTNKLSGSVYACGAINPGEPSAGGFIRYSVDGSSGSFSNLYGFKGDNDAYGIHDMEVWKNDNVNTEYLVVVGTSGSATGGISGRRYPTIWRSQQTIPANHSGNLSVVYNSTDAQSEGAFALTRFSSSVWVAVGNKGVVLSSSNNATSGSWIDMFSDSSSRIYFRSVAVNDAGDVYVVGYNDQLASGFIKRSDRGISGSLSEIYQFDSNGSLPENSSEFTKIVAKDEDIFVCGDTRNNGLDDNVINYYLNVEMGGLSFVKKGKRQIVSGSIGPQMLAISFGYVQREGSGSTNEIFNLNNISEFPHSFGLFQMPNIVIGTKTYGKAGKTDDSLIQKRFIGSFVRVLFPKQDENSEIKGHDAARKPGKLTPDWQFGDVINIEGKNFDSLALNCYVAKQVSGTLDSVLVRIETKPINDIGYSVEQSIEQTISSSFASETVYRDEIHRKDVDYGDTSLNEIAWKIPIDLKNTKEIRIAAKHKNGQTDDKNKQFLIMGRFVKSSKDTEET